MRPLLLLPFLLVACTLPGSPEAAYKAAIQVAMDRRTQECQDHPEWKCQGGARVTGVEVVEPYTDLTAEIPGTTEATVVRLTWAADAGRTGGGSAYIDLVKGRWITSAITTTPEGVASVPLVSAYPRD